MRRRNYESNARLSSILRFGDEKLKHYGWCVCDKTRWKFKVMLTKMVYTSNYMLDIVTFYHLNAKWIKGGKGTVFAMKFNTLVYYTYCQSITCKVYSFLFSL